MTARPKVHLLCLDAERSAQVAADLAELGCLVWTGPSAPSEPVSAVLCVVTREDELAQVRLALREKRGDAPLLLWLDGVAEPLLDLVGELGASGLGLGPVKRAELACRLGLLLRGDAVRRELARKERDAQLALELTRTLSSTLEFHEILFTVVRRIAEVVNVDRVSVVLTPPNEPGTGYVIAASDDQEVSNLKLLLDRYPEIVQVVETGQPLTINDIATHPLLDGVRSSVPPLSALSLLPIASGKQVIGVLFLRTLELSRALSPVETEVCSVIANASVPALQNALRLHKEREEKAEALHLSEARVRAEMDSARELKKSKEFLESLIDASVDAIVAADLKGTILLFNKGAEHIYGYRTEDVIGKMNVAKLYPEGMAKEVMRRIRSQEHGGVGRLYSMNGAAVTREGAKIPISLSAAMIYEHGAPTATVGIFTDLREKLKAEERLLHVQRKLELSEKQALLAELAGTAAHELNQPLTSVMGYGELLLRRLPAGTPERNAAHVIMQEAERMADLVRKIGRITRYETKSYVGDQRILDLDRASNDPDEVP